MSPVSKKGEKRIVENCWQKSWGHLKHPEGKWIFPRIWKKLVSVLPVQLILITLSKMLGAGLLYETLRIPMIFCFLEILWFVSQKASWVALETMSPYVSTYHWEVKRCPCSGQLSLCSGSLFNSISRFIVIEQFSFWLENHFLKWYPIYFFTPYHINLLLYFYFSFFDTSFDNLMPDGRKPILDAWYFRYFFVITIILHILFLFKSCK